MSGAPPSKIRRMTLQDAKALMQLHARAFAKGEAWTQEAFETLLRLETTRAFGVARDGALCALLILQRVADEAEILTLATDPSLQRQGLARQLLEYASTDEAVAEVKTWLLDVAADNSGALAFYQALGFQSDGRRPQYYKRLEGPRVDAILMSKQVGGQPAR